ncbi:5-oxoprolinase subunit C family protein [Deinococcus multiflagellatus]|uniref:5-oxoprolinase subunit C family protein n=1 Tax=Deinococcus multiflagellatus TaxID=1656887 RepID=UPI001CCA4EEA|nr:biotin-dependent carboxyltransferase family protein [Deinococcus multiflagellatus]MBZ9715182.1 biotin-dependent carboxyltransferase family protein [Deinococcus multiflagellatus]
MAEPAQPSRALVVLRPGLQTTVQDAGRRARALGVPGGGAADSTARRLGNALVGNPATVAGLELTLLGPALRFEAPALVSLCGAPFGATLDGIPLPLWRAVAVQAGQTLDVRGTPAGLRAFLAVRGGLDGQEVFGSRATDPRSGFGGLEGRALRAGDRLTWGAAALAPAPRALPSPEVRTPFGPHHRLRVLPTPDLTPALEGHLCGPVFTVAPQADRMGVRLTEAVPAPHDPTRPSVPNVPGLVQLPPDGRPILLLPDAGTHGGYPSPLVVIQADQPRLGQLRPGDTLQFEAVPLAVARQALMAQEQALRQAETALRLHFASV